MGQKKRQSNIELFRLIMMFVIVMHHTILYGLFETDLTFVEKCTVEVFASLGKVGVAGFMLITGYFSINKMKNNIASLKSTHHIVWFYSLLAMVVFLPTGLVSRSLMIKSFFPVICGNYWFVTAFFVTMLLAPFINRGFQTLDKKSSQHLLLIMMILLTVLQLIPRQELELGNGMLFILFYLTGGYIRRFVNPRDLSRWKLVGFAMVLFIIMNIGNFISTYLDFESMPFSSNTSVFVYLIATLLFLLFLSFDMGSIGFINSISSMTFAVYLIHDNPIVRDYIWTDLLKLHHYQPRGTLSLIMTILCSALLVFIGSLIIEGIRLMLVSFYDIGRKKERQKQENGEKHNMAVVDNDLDIAYTVSLPTMTRSEYREYLKKQRR